MKSFCFLHTAVSRIGRQFQPHKISSVVVADRADRRNFGSTVNIAAFHAHPGCFHSRRKEFSFFQPFRELTETVSVNFLDFRNLSERIGDFQKSFFLRFPGKVLVHIIMFFVFIMLCHA